MEVLLSQRSGDTWGGVPICERNHFFTQISRNNFHEKNVTKIHKKLGLVKTAFINRVFFENFFV